MICEEFAVKHVELGAEAAVGARGRTLESVEVTWVVVLVRDKNVPDVADGEAGRLKMTNNGGRVGVPSSENGVEFRYFKLALAVRSELDPKADELVALVVSWKKDDPVRSLTVTAFVCLLPNLLGDVLWWHHR